MAIKKRLSAEERIKKRLPKGWRACLKHPLMQKLCFTGKFDPTPVNVDTAIGMTKSWKGATYQQKAFTHVLDILLEKSGRKGILTAEQYERLQDHLTLNLDKIEQSDWHTWHIWLWDVYHDFYRLHDLETGGLTLPTPTRAKLTQRVSTPPPAPKKRKRLAKHSKA